MQSLLDELKEMQAKLSAIIARLEAEHNTVTATLAEIRRVAVLEEIYRAGGMVTAKEVSCFAEKYGAKIGWRECQWRLFQMRMPEIRK